MELAAERGYDLSRSFAYSDSATDVPMLEAVGHPYAVNPDRTLRKEAMAREWPILVFDKPVALRSRVGELAAKPAVSGTALALALATAGTIWWLGTRGRRRRALLRPGLTLSSPTSGLEPPRGQTLASALTGRSASGRVPGRFRRGRSRAPSSCTERTTTRRSVSWMAPIATSS